MRPLLLGTAPSRLRQASAHWGRGVTGEWTVTLPASQKPGGPAGIALVAGPRPPPGSGWVFALLPPAPFSDGTLPPMGPSPPSSAPKDAALGCVVPARVPMGAWGQTRARLEGRGSRQWAAGPGAKEGQLAGQTPALRPPPAPSGRGVGLPSAQPAARCQTGFPWFYICN